MSVTYCAPVISFRTELSKKEKQGRGRERKGGDWRGGEKRKGGERGGEGSERGGGREGKWRKGGEERGGEGRRGEEKGGEAKGRKNIEGALDGIHEKERMENKGEGRSRKGKERTPCSSR